MSTLRQFRFTAFERQILIKAITERIKQVQADPSRNGNERYKLQQLLEKLSDRDVPKPEGDPQPDADG